MDKLYVKGVQNLKKILLDKFWEYSHVTLPFLGRIRDNISTI